MVEKITNPLGHVTELGDYNQFGYPQQVTDANNGIIEQNRAGRITSYGYDLAGNLTSVILPGQVDAISCTYYGSSRPGISKKDFSCKTTRFQGDILIFSAPLRGCLQLMHCNLFYPGQQGLLLR